MTTLPTTDPGADGARHEPPLLLVVDDEPLIRMVVSDHLRATGYHVMEAGTADDAVAMLRRHPDIRLVVSDVLMPGALNGFDLAEWIGHHRPDVRILLTSGHFSRVTLPSRLNWTGELVRKPYDLAGMARRIAILLRCEPHDPADSAR